MKLTLSEFSIVAILLLIVVIMASVGTKALQVTAQSLLDKALEVSEPKR